MSETCAWTCYGSLLGFVAVGCSSASLDMKIDTCGGLTLVMIVSLLAATLDRERQ